MPGRSRRNRIFAKPEVFDIRWYPSSKVCTNSDRREAQFKYMPPLMVRKAEWRR